VPGLIFSMMAQGYAWCIQRGLTHLTGAANPDVMPVFEKSGWKRIGDPFHHQGSGLRVQPGVLVVDELNERFKAFQRQQRIEHVFSDFDRVLYREGEFLCRAGEVAEHVFVVVDGQLRVTSESGQELARLGPSQVVGEVALLTAQRRTANVQAVEDTWLMMLSRTDFNRQLAERPEAARLVLELLAHRFAGLIRELDESR